MESIKLVSWLLIVLTLIYRYQFQVNLISMLSNWDLTLTTNVWLLFSYVLLNAVTCQTSHFISMVIRGLDSHMLTVLIQVLTKSFQVNCTSLIWSNWRRFTRKEERIYSAYLMTFAQSWFRLKHSIHQTTEAKVVGIVSLLMDASTKTRHVLMASLRSDTKE